MLWHEMSQSAGFMDWAKDYDYMYVHVDIAFQFLEVLAEYDRASGDDAFLRAHWPKVLKAYRYCLSTLDAGDGLPRVPHDKMSGNEQDRLTDELTLSAAWVDASGAMSGLAQAMGDAKLAAQARAASERARTSIRARYRDTQAGRWISGFKRSGEPGESFSYADLAAISSGAATPAEAAATFDRLQSPEYLTAWGLRSKPTSAGDYDPEAYSRGSVWGLGSAAASERMWRSGRANQAAELWQRLVPWAGQDSLGHMHEVQSGTTFTPQSESVPEQTWSSAAFLSAAIGGMLGLEADARRNVLRFAPQPPQGWHSLKAERVRVGKSVVDLEWRNENGKASLDVRNNGPAFHLVWTQAGVETSSEIPPGHTRLAAP
jgi:glycogen debranching enzyme